MPRWPGPAVAAAAAVVAGVVWFIITAAWPAAPGDALDAELKTFVNRSPGARALKARLSPAFPWAPPALDDRGSQAFKPTLDLREAAVRLERLATSDRNAATLGAVGMSRLSLGQIDDGVAVLMEAAQLDPRRAVTYVDLAAGHLARWDRTAAATDAIRALDTAETALALSSRNEAAGFNRSLSLAALGLTEAAKKSWLAFLGISTDEEWRREARDHLERLTQAAVRPPSPAELLRVDPHRLDELVRTRPAHLEAAIASTVPRGLEETSQLGEADSTALRAWADALVRADRDRFWPDVVNTALGRSTSRAERRCLAAALVALAGSRARFDASDYAGAEQEAEKAVAMLGCAGASTIDARMQRVWAQFFRERRDEAVPVARTLAAEASRAGRHRIVARAEYLIGLRHAAATRPDEALRAFAVALSAASRAGDDELVAVVTTAEAEIYRNIGEPEMAWKPHTTALRLLPLLTSRRQHVVLTGAARTATASLQHHAADVLANEIVAIASASSDAARIVSAHLHHARTLVELNRHDAAARALADAAAAMPSIDEAALRRQYEVEMSWLSALAARSAKPAEAVRQLDVVFTALVGTGRKYRLAEVLLERGRASSALGDRAGAIDAWSRAIDYFEQEGARIGDRQLRISRADRLWDLFGEMIAAHMNDPAAALRFAERSRARALLEDAADGVAAAAVDVATTDWIPDDVDLVYYATLPEQLVVWHITRAGIRSFVRPVTSGRLDQSVAASVRAVQTNTGNALPELSTLLLPDQFEPRGRRLVFLPDGVLHRVPFSLLIAPGTGRRLFQDATTMVAPSLSILFHGRWQAPAARQVLLAGFGEPTPNEGLPALPGVAREIDDLVRLYEGHGLTTLVGRAATAKAIAARIGEADVVHFAGHAVANELYPSRSKLVTAPDGDTADLTADAVRGQLRPGAIVVLSACDTAVSRVYRGEGALGMARPFLASGASAVLATLWKVRDGQTIGLLHAFHEGLKNGLGPGRALAAARRAAIQQGSSIENVGVFELMTASLEEGSNGR